MLWVRACLFVCLAALSGAAQADELDAWLQKMKQAMMSSNYEGVLIIRQDDQMQSLRVKHGMDQQGMWESLDSLNGESRRIMRTGGRVTTIFPDRNLLTISRYSLASPMHPQVPNDHKKFRQYYDVVLLGQDRVAEKNARILDIIPKDQYRYGFRFWLEENSGLLLRCDLKSADGDIVEQLMYSQLTLLDSPPKKDDFSHQAQYKVVNMDARRADVKDSPLTIRQLPQGFEQIQASRQPALHAEGDVYHLVYSDGMASVSVFMQKNSRGKQAFKGLSKMGAVNVMVQPLGDYQVTVLGEVPVATVKMMALSAQLNKRQNHD